MDRVESSMDIAAFRHYNPVPMGSLRYFRRVQIAPGVRLNLGRRGASLSLGVRGAHITLGRSGIRRTVGLPGTGVFYTSRTGRHSGLHSAPQFTARPAPQAPSSRRGLAAILLLTLALIVLAVIGQVFGR